MAIKVQGTTVIDDSRQLNATGISTLGTVQISSGIVTATTGIVTYYGDGQYLENLPGFNQDADGNLFAGDGAGGSYDPGACSACFNTFLGCNAGNSITSGDYNNFFGPFAGRCNTTGSNNTFLGKNAGALQTTPADNIFLGSNAGYGNVVKTDGCGIAIGRCAGYNGNTTFNVFIGKDAGINYGGGGFCNVFLGQSVGSASTSLSGSTLIGLQAGCCASGTHTIIVGTFAGRCSTGNCSIILGKNAGELASGNENIFLGQYAGKCATSAGNVFIGGDSGCCNTSGTCNVAIGVAAGRGNTGALTGSFNTFFGYRAGINNTSGSNNNFLGKCAGYGGSGGVTGSNNTAIGLNAGKCLTSGACNVFLGVYAGQGNTTGSFNNFLGYGAGLFNCSGSRNNFLGINAGQRNTTGCYNTFLGSQAGYCNTTGCYNTFLGWCAGYGGSGGVTGNNNTAIGQDAGKCLTSGGCNVFLGQGAGNTNTSGSCNIAIGRDVELPSATSNGQLAIGDGTNRWIMGDDSFRVGIATVTIDTNVALTVGGAVTATAYYGDGSNLENVGLSLTDDTTTNATRYVLFDDATSGSISSVNVSSTKLTFNPSTGNLVAGGTVTANSDEKLKENIKTIENALDKVLSLRGVEYDRIDTGDHQIGVIAQEVEIIIPDVVYGDETKSVAYGNLVGLLIEALKEQNRRIDELERRLEEN